MKLKAETSASNRGGIHLRCKCTNPPGAESDHSLRVSLPGAAIIRDPLGSGIRNSVSTRNSEKTSPHSSTRQRFAHRMSIASGTFSRVVLAAVSSLLDPIRRASRRFAAAPVGQRFVAHYERRQAAEEHSKLLAVLEWVLAVVFLCLALVFVVLPGPAILCFAIVGALLSSHSRGLAQLLDRTDLRVRAYAAKFRRKR